MGIFFVVKSSPSLQAQAAAAQKGNASQEKPNCAGQ